MGIPICRRSIRNRLGRRPKVRAGLHEALAERADGHRNGGQPVLPGAGGPDHPGRHGLRHLDGHRCGRDGHAGDHSFCRAGDGVACRLPAPDRKRRRRPQVHRFVNGELRAALLNRGHGVTGDEDALAQKIADAAAERLRATGLAASRLAKEGAPKQALVDEAQEWDDLYLRRRQGPQGAE